MMLQQLTYISTARLAASDADVEAILLASRRNNRRDGITGLLVYDGKRFLQALEGSASAVEATYARIKLDPRHRAAVILSVREVLSPEFGNWNMACERVTTGVADESIADTVDSIVAGLTNPSTKALFSSFARLDRSKAA